jgi:hypothetical protein
MVERPLLSSTDTKIRSGRPANRVLLLFKLVIHDPSGGQSPTTPPVAARMGPAP